MEIRRKALVALVAVLAWPVGGCRTDDPMNERGGEAASAAPAPRAVRVARAREGRRDDGFPSSLYVERDVKLAARRSGLIESVLVDRGQRVKAGKELARLETDLAERELDMAGDELRLAEAEFERADSLRRSNIASAQEYQRIEISRDVAKSRVELARAMLERCRIRAPFDGIVVERWAVVGMRVQEDDGTPLFRVVADEPPRARVDVPEGMARRLDPRVPATIAVAGRDIPGRIVFIAPAVDAASGTVPVIVEAATRQPGVRPGAAARVRFDRDFAASSERVAIPRDALSPGEDREGSEATILVVADGRVSLRQVRVVEVRDEDSQVEGDVRVDETVVLGSRAGLEAGAIVEPREDGS